MPDISMCLSDICERRYECYRHEAVPSQYQAYAVFNPTDCEYFMPTYIDQPEVIS
jgi:hypothetical protein